jgi:Fic family protein
MARLDGQASLIQSRAFVVRPLLTREAVESARLEGTHTHIAGVLFQAAGDVPADADEAISNREVLNYLHASGEGDRWLADGRPLNVHLVLSLHNVLLTGTRGEDRQPGGLRTRQVLIGAQGDTPLDARFVPPPPEEVRPALDNLVEFMARADHFPPLIAAGIAHYQFETIHPFEDGNGRLGRLLIPLQLIATGALTHALLYLSPYLERRRDDYLGLLKRVSTHGAWHDWIAFFLDAVIAQAEDARARVARVMALQETYRARAQTLRSKAPATMIPYVMERVVVTAPEVARAANCAYNTAVAALDALAAIGVVEPLRGTHPQRWWAHELVRLVYEA